MNLVDIAKAEGKNNYGGLLVDSYWALASDIETFPPFGAEGTDIDGAPLTIDLTALTFKTGKNFIKVESSDEKTGLSIKKVGGRDNNAKESIFSMAQPGNHPVFAHFLEYVGTRDLVIVCKDGDNTRLIGLPGYPAKIDTDEYDSGKSRDTDAETMVSVKMVGKPAVFCTGEPNTTPAV